MISQSGRTPVGWNNCFLITLSRAAYKLRALSWELILCGSVSAFSTNRGNAECYSDVWRFFSFLGLSCAAHSVSPPLWSPALIAWQESHTHNQLRLFACFAGLPHLLFSFPLFLPFPEMTLSDFETSLSPLALALRFLCVYLFLFWEDHTEGWHAWGSSVLGGLKAWKTRGDGIGLQSAREVMRVDSVKPVSWRPREEKENLGNCCAVPSKGAV